MVNINVQCLRHQSTQCYRHRQDPKGYGRFSCRDCHRMFQL
ncbi:IS1 family transposase [Pectobacterium fontis]